MTTWANLLDGYPIYARLQDSHPHLFVNGLHSRMDVGLWMDFLAELFPMFRFVFEAFLAAFLIVLFLAVWSIILVPFFKRLSRLIL